MTGHTNGEILQRIAILETKVDKIGDRQEAIDANLSGLNAYANKGRGAITAVLTIWTLLSIFIGAGLSYLLSR